MKNTADKPFSKKRRFIRFALLACCALLIAGLGIVFSGDPLSAVLRSHTESAINHHLSAMRERAAAHQLTSTDRFLLHVGVLAGIAIGQFISPEGAAILKHAVYGDGSELQLDASYFKQSHFLAIQVKRLGLGTHGPIRFAPHYDWRLALAFNPVFITVSTESIRIGHPRLAFAAPDAPPVYTIVPIGKMRIRVYDNLVGALQSKPFPAYAQWQPDFVSAK